MNAQQQINLDPTLPLLLKFEYVPTSTSPPPTE